MTSEVMDSGLPLLGYCGCSNDCGGLGGRQHNEKERFQPVVRSVVVVLSISMVGKR